MRYQFLDPGDEKLIQTSELPTEKGIALAVRSTGYDVEDDEVLQLAVVDFDGNELFFKTVKPQNKEDWTPSDATGGLTPSDVADQPELYQFEEEVSDLFENVDVVVGQHMPFIEEIIESSWVTLPAFDGLDLISLFCASHCTDDYRNEPAAVATLAGIADYYGIAYGGTSLPDEARAVVACYRALVKEHADERAAKGEAYWARHNERLAEEEARDAAKKAIMQKREKNFNRMNGLLWVASALIFVSLAIQMYQRGFDVGFIIICIAVAVFAATRAVVNFRR